MNFIKSHFKLTFATLGSVRLGVALLVAMTLGQDPTQTNAKQRQNVSASEVRADLKPEPNTSGGEAPHAPPRVASPQIAYHGKRLSFVVPPPPAGVWSMAVEKQPRGEIAFDTRSGVFAYTPAPADKEDFDVR